MYNTKISYTPPTSSRIVFAQRLGDLKSDLRLPCINGVFKDEHGQLIYDAKSKYPVRPGTWCIRYDNNRWSFMSDAKYQEYLRNNNPNSI